VSSAFDDYMMHVRSSNIASGGGLAPSNGSDNIFGQTMKSPFGGGLSVMEGQQQKGQVQFGLVFAKLCAGMQGSIGQITPAGINAVGNLPSPLGNLLSSKPGVIQGKGGPG
jgi:hypothetical protein